MATMVAKSIPFALFLLVAPAVAGASAGGNLDTSNAIERVAVSADGRLQAWDMEGRQVPGWPKSLAAGDRYFAYGPRLIDVDFDLQEEVVVVSAAVGGGSLQLHVFKGNGTELPSWHFSIPHAAIVETPIIADINHDSSLEIAYTTTDNQVVVYRRNFQPLANFPQQLTATPRLTAADPDNDGLDGLFAAAGDQILAWDAQGVASTLFTVPNGGEVIGNIAASDINRDAYPDLIFSTTGDRIIAIDQHGKVLIQIEAPEGAHFAAEVVVDDIDVDKLPELVVTTATGDVLAYETSGANVASWSYQTHFREPAFVSGVVANDRYRGLFATVTGWDQSLLYRTKHHRYARIVVGENVREWDTFANFDWLEIIAIADVFTFPKPFTPNGDGVNDTTLVHYRIDHPALVALDLYDANEHFLSRIQEKALRAAGEHQEIWNGMNTKGTVTPKDDLPLDTGLYLIKVVAESPEGFVSIATVSTIVNGVKARIEIPKDNDETDAIYPKVFGVVSLSGIATDPNFGENNLDADFHSYKLYYRPGIWTMTDQEIVTVGKTGSGWLPLVVPLAHQCPTPDPLEPNDTAYPVSNVSCRPVQHGVIGSFDTTNMGTTPNGEYTLLVKVMDSNQNTVGKVHYDTLVVTVANPNPADPYDPKNLYDTNNPANPIYLGPKITGVGLTNALISLQNPTTVISYTLENETANIHLTIYPENDGATSPVVAVYSFNHLAPNDPGNPKYQFTWNGTNTLGRNVPGGHYRIRITADAIDGTGVNVNDTLSLDVTKGFAASDVLSVATDPATGEVKFSATPLHFAPIGFGEDLQPEKTYFDYALTKEAKVTLQVLEDVPGVGLSIRKTLSSGIIKKYDNGNEYWDGSGDNGVLLPVGKDYIVRLTAESIDIGNEATIMRDLVVHLDDASLDGSLPADITQLKGDGGEVANDDALLTAMAGNPDFLWRAKGTGYVQIPFDYAISGQAENQYSYFQEGWTETSEWKPMRVCHYHGHVSSGDLPWSGTSSVDKFVSLTEKFSLLFPPYVQPNNPPVAAHSDNASVHPAVLIDWEPKDVSGGQTVTAHIQRGGGFNVIDEGKSYGDAIYLNSYIPECSNPRTLSFLQGSQCGDLAQLYAARQAALVNGMPLDPVLAQKIADMEACYANIQWPCPNLGLEWTVPEGVLWDCGNAQATLTGKIPMTGTCSSSTITTSGSGDVSSSQGQVSPATFSVNLLATCKDQTTVIGGTTFNTQYALWLKGKINGYEPEGSSNGQVGDGYLYLPGLKGWMGNESGPAYSLPTAYVAMNPSFPGGIYDTAKYDDYLANAPYRKIWGAYTGFNDDYYRRETKDVSFYWDGYQHIFGGDPGTALYSFSDVVHLTDWSLEVRYPNISVGKPDGDNLLDSIFALENITFNNPDKPGAANKNSNVRDTFRLRLKPLAVPRRFVEIWGSAGSDYELYYYDNTTETPQWKAISPRQASPVNNGLLAHWDVTGLNGKQYTVVLKTKSGDQVNIDTMDIGIGTWVDTSGLGPNEFVRVDSTFKKASLIFGAGSLPEPRLVTITPVDPKEAAFKLPSGIPPLGPIFDIKPDDIQIDQKYHAQMEITFTPKELEEVQVDPTELTIYNLAGDELLEGLATIATFDNMDDDDPTNDVWRFTAVLEHFSQYFIGKKMAGYVHVAAPKPESYLHDTVEIIARVETFPRSVDQPDAPQPLAALTSVSISYHPVGAPGASAPIDSQTIAQPTTALADIHIPWDVHGLNGNFVLRIAAEGPQGAKVTHVVPVAIDHSATTTILRINGNAVADGAIVSAAVGATIELVSTDSASMPWQSGVQMIEMRFDGGEFVPYTQPFAIPHATGAHTIVYHGIDKNQNIEEDRTATIVIQEAMAPEDLHGVDVQLQVSGPQYSANDQTWVSSDTTFTFSATGGVAEQIKYRVGDAAYIVYDKPFAITTDAEGGYHLEYFAVDTFGLHAAIHSRLLLLDRTPPVSAFDAIGLAVPQGNEIVIAPATTIALSAWDDGATPAGLDRIEYKRGDDPWKIYTDPLTFAATTPLAFRAIDRVGNIEPAHQYTVRIDDIGPTLGVITAPQVISPNNDGRHDTAAIVVQTADNLYANLTLRMVLQTTDGDGIVAIDNAPLQPGMNTLTWDGKVNGEPLPEASYPYIITILDAGANASAPYQGTLVYDLTPPTAVVLGSAVRSFSPNGDAIFDVLQVDYTVTDNLFAQDLLMKLQVLTFAGEENLLTASETVATPPEQHTLAWNGTNAAANGVFDGNYRFHLIAEDPAGNRSTPVEGDAQSTGEIFVDTVAPVTQLTIDGPTYPAVAPGTPWLAKLAPEKVWLGPGATIRLTAIDPVPGSGVAAILHGFDEPSMQPYKGPFTLPAEDVDYLLYYEAHDVVGNVEVVHQQAVRLDTHAPTSVLTIGQPQETDVDGNLYLSPTAPIDLAAEDGKGVGIDTIWIELTGVKAPSPYEQTVLLDGLGDGTYTLKYWAADRLGTLEAARQQTFRLDGTAPVTTLDVGEPKYPDAQSGVLYVTSATPIGFQATTDRDDLATTEYRLDDGPWLPAAPIALAEERAYTIAWRSTDRLGNVEALKTQTVVVDNSAPTPQLSFSQTAAGDAAYVTPLTQVTLGGLDAGANIAGIEYRIDGGASATYTTPFGFPDGTPGVHTIVWRVRDRVGNSSAMEARTVQMIDVDVTREAMKLPRVLVFMLQTHDVRANDPRPTTALIESLEEELGGYVTVIAGDQNDPATIERFLAAMRSDKYTTFLFASDAVVVKFYDTDVVRDLLRELNARIVKGDTFCSLIGHTQIEGKAWDEFHGNHRPADANYTGYFAGVSSGTGIAARQYGKGRIAEFGGDLGRIAGSTPTQFPAVVTGLADLIRGIMPTADENNAGEVTDYTLTYYNHGDRAVVVHTTEQLPSGWIESAATKGEVAVLTRDFDLTVPPKSTAIVDYLYRPSVGVGAYAIGTTTQSTWTDGLRSARAFTTPYAVVHGLQDLFHRLTGANGLLAHGEAPAAREQVEMVERRLTFGADGIHADTQVSALITMLLDAMDELQATTAANAEEARSLIAEIIEGLGALQSTGALTQSIAVGEGDPNDPASYHGDTTSHLSSGDGGCAMVEQRTTVCDDRSVGLGLFTGLALWLWCFGRMRARLAARRRSASSRS